MYDTLIDELRQDAGGNPEETISLAEKAVETMVSGDDEAEKVNIERSLQNSRKKGFNA